MCIDEGYYILLAQSPSALVLSAHAQEVTMCNKEACYTHVLYKTNWLQMSEVIALSCSFDDRRL